MYENFFRLSEAPFDGLPDERFYYVGSAQKQALTLLSDQLSRQGALCVLQGPSGTGKTTLVRMLIRTLPQRMRIIAIDDPRLNPHLLLATILRASGVPATSLESVSELTFRLRQYLEDPSRAGEMVTVIIDEAQGLSDACLEQVRLVSNIESSSGRRINFLLVGQEELTARIQRSDMRMFYSRVRAFAAVPPLKRDEVQAYISFRLQQAGCHEPLFTQKAVGVIFKESKGLPRLVNSIADESLNLACEHKTRTVSSRLVRRAVRLVRRHHAGLGERLRGFIKALCRAVFVRLPLLGLGIAISALCFWLCWRFLPHAMDSQSIEAAVSGSAQVQKARDDYFKTRVRSLTGRGREEALFYRERANSRFKSDAVAALISLWGWARSDDSRITCDDLGNTGLRCAAGQGSLDEALRNNRPLVLSMRDEDLTPYYALLVKAEDGGFTLLLGQHLFSVREEYLRSQFDGEFLAVLPDDLTPADPADGFDKKKQSQDAALLECVLGLRAGYIQNLNSYSQAYRAFQFRHPDEEEQELRLDLCSKRGPYLRAAADDAQ